MATTTKSPVQRTVHPHIVKSEGTLSCEPRVDGTPAGEIAISYPPLKLVQVYDALSYAHDHRDEIA